MSSLNSNINYAIFQLVIKFYESNFIGSNHMQLIFYLLFFTKYSYLNKPLINYSFKHFKI